jgi:hypothetical protein
MDVTRIIAELRAEREDIEQAILYLEQPEAAARPVIAIARTGGPPTRTFSSLKTSRLAAHGGDEPASAA